MAKPPMNGRLLLWGSWTGNALLTILAVYVAVTHAGPLPPGTILTIAVCILSGNLLPLGAHTLLYFREKLVLMAEQAQAGESLREALSRLAEAESRLTEARDASAKATLVARQIPDRIEERFQAVSKAMPNLDTAALADLNGEVRGCIESLAAATARIDELSRGGGAEEGGTARAQNADIRSGLDILQAKVEALAKGISDLGDELRDPSDISDAFEGKAARAPETAPPPQATEGEAADGEATAGDPDGFPHRGGRVDFSEDDDPFDGVEDELRAGGASTSGRASTELEAFEPEPTEPPSESETPSTEPPPKNRPGAVERPPESDFKRAVKDMEAPSGGTETAAPPDSKKRKPAEKQSGKAKPKKKRAPDAVPPELFSAEEMSDGAPASPEDTILEAHAMIGIQNKLFVRGDPPLLNWEEGVPLDLTGIGEYQWKAPAIKEPLHCKLLLNDERWAIGENLVLQPGRKLVTRPKF